jgi:hypothetical protein
MTKQNQTSEFSVFDIAHDETPRDKRSTAMSCAGSASTSHLTRSVVTTTSSDKHVRTHVDKRIHTQTDAHTRHTDTKNKNTHTHRMDAHRLPIVVGARSGRLLPRSQGLHELERQIAGVGRGGGSDGHGTHSDRGGHEGSELFWAPCKPSQAIDSSHRHERNLPESKSESRTNGIQSSMATPTRKPQPLQPKANRIKFRMIMVHTYFRWGGGGRGRTCIDKDCSQVSAHPAFIVI